MFPKYHIVFGAVFSLFILYAFPQISFIGAGIIFLSSVLIDVDHYLNYVFKKKDWSLKRAYRWHIEMTKKFLALPREERNGFYIGLCFLHGVEILAVLYILGIFLSNYFLFILMGFAFHLFLDVIYQTTYWDRVDRVSIVWDYFKYKRLKRLKEDNLLD